MGCCAVWCGEAVMPGWTEVCGGERLVRCEGKSGQVRSGQVRSGQVRSGVVRCGEVCAVTYRVYMRMWRGCVAGSCLFVLLAPLATSSATWPPDPLHAQMLPAALHPAPCTMHPVPCTHRCYLLPKRRMSPNPGLRDGPSVRGTEGGGATESVKSERRLNWLRTGSGPVRRRG